MWDQDEWFAGTVTNYNIINGLSQLLYDDKDNKWHDLSVDRWRLAAPRVLVPLEREPLAPTTVASVQARAPAATCTSSTLFRDMCIAEVTAHTIVAADEGWTLNMCRDGWPWDTYPILDNLFCLFDIALLSLSRGVLSKVVQVSKQCHKHAQPILHQYGPVVRSVLYGAAILKDSWCRKVRHLLTPNLPTTQPTGTKMWFGSIQLADKFHQFFNKFRLLRKLYRKKIPLCKHEVAFHEVRAFSYGNWYPVRCLSSLVSVAQHL